MTLLIHGECLHFPDRYLTYEKCARLGLVFSTQYDFKELAVPVSQMDFSVMGVSDDSILKHVINFSSLSDNLFVPNTGRFSDPFPNDTNKQLETLSLITLSGVTRLLSRPRRHLQKRKMTLTDSQAF